MRPDYRRIHQLEYELGFRDDAPPPPVPSDAPGAVVYYRPKKRGQPPSVVAQSSLLKELYTAPPTGHATGHETA